ncbi:MAG: hypothetical protein LBP89_00805 [Helicobacteraceae bacterium]|jgi:hypothetical protein|nr:hypothetical protein [Helicobacteraceae bacterium]
MNVKFISAALVGCAVLLCGGCAKTPIPSLDGFVCSDQNKTLTPEELKQKEKRIKQLERALDNTVGLEFDGHGFKFFQFGVKTCRVYDLQRKLTLQDWKLLSEMIIENYSSAKSHWFDTHRSEVVEMMFILREEALDILKCELTKRGLPFAGRFDFGTFFTISAIRARERIMSELEEKRVRIANNRIIS